MYSATRRFLAVLVDLVYPKRCAGCGAYLPPRETFEMCADCLDGLPWLTEPFCRICGDDFSVPDAADAGAFADRVCRSCRSDHPGYSLARSALKHEGAARSAIHEFKFHGRRALAATLADLMLRSLAGNPNELTGGLDAVIYVPLHPARERERGYNQAAELAREIAGPLGLPLLRGSLERSRSTPPQVGLNRPDRMTNVKGAFTASGSCRVEGLALLLVDDVMTTGATASECARKLLQAGAREIRVATFARG